MHRHRAWHGLSLEKLGARLKLKYQLLLLALLSLVFPFSGWIALKSVDTQFRQALEQTAKNSLLSLKASVQQIIKNNQDYELHGLVSVDTEKIILDGDDSDWSDQKAYSYGKTDTLVAKLAVSGGKLYLYLESNDRTFDIHSLDNSNNDELVVAIANNRGLYKYSFFRQAEGWVLSASGSNERPDYKAYWHEKSDGYALEMELTGTDYHHLGFVTVNRNKQQKHLAGTLESSGENLKLIPLVSLNQELAETIHNITSDNNMFVIKDSENRVIYQSNKLPQNPTVSAWQWLITPIYQWLFGIVEDNGKNNWFYRQEDGMAGVKYSISENGITYELQSMLPQGQQNMIQTLLKAAILMILVVFVIMIAYLIYSLVLAWRIKRLNRALQTVLDDSGRLNILMPSNKSGDEIGQLSRGIETMLSEMREYTQYLKELGSRLSHEMKTPLAIVQSSLDNLELEYNEDFLARAKSGTHRLKFILNQLSELSKLKYTLENTPKERFNISSLCNQLGESYKSFIPQLQLNICREDVFVDGSGDLMAQMIDKIIENAVDFTPKEGAIELNLKRENKTVILSVINSGSQLPEGQVNIFDSLVSNRDKKSKKSHLGLGLYISQLIARYHNSKVIAENLADENKVKFSISLEIVNQSD